MNKNNLEIYRLLVELKNDNHVPKRYEKELERCLRHVEESIENKNKTVSKKVLSAIARIFMSVIDP